MKTITKKHLSMALILALILALVPAVPVMAADSDAAFTDVPADAWYAEAVAWAAEETITNGVGNQLFAPAGTVTRAQAVTFLWRMAGRPDPAGTDTFSDVEAGSWYEAAVQWAVEQKIIEGTGDGKFSPEGTLDRAMCLTMLYRMQGATLDAIDAMEPIDLEALGEDATFEDWGNAFLQQIIYSFRDADVLLDVEQGSYYELAVIWGAMNGILTEDNTAISEDEGIAFCPADPCVRAEMVSFLYQVKLLEDMANAPELLESGPMVLPIPQAYSDRVYRIIHGTPDDEDGMLFTISEIASRNAAEALGEDPDETGLGELFSIARVSEDDAAQIIRDDLGDGTVFARDENGKYYVLFTPTDVCYVRETVEQMAADQAQWDELMNWVSNEVIDGILQYSEGLTPVDGGSV